MTDYKVIADNLNKIAPSLEIPSKLSKDKYPYYLDQPYLNIYGGLPNSGGDDNIKKPLTFKILSNGYINWGCIGESAETIENAATVEYSKNGGEWTEITALPLDPQEMTGGTKIDVVVGDIVQFRGDNDVYCDFNNVLLGSFIFSTCGFELEGNIMSLIDSTNFSSITAMTADNDGAFMSMFEECTGLTSAEKLVLPATTLAENCYRCMFQNCTSLTTAPELPATTLANSGYSFMFAGCTSLTTAPELPATTLADGCYSYMFSGCTSLTTAPELPATTLAYSCYHTMFGGCSSLTTAPELLATTLADSCYYEMFSDCTSLATAPELPATTLASYCYSFMFYYCTSLNYIKCLATDISASDCTTDWVNNVASSGTFVKNPNMSNWTTGINGIPSGWTVQDAQ